MRTGRILDMFLIAIMRTDKGNEYLIGVSCHVETCVLLSKETCKPKEVVSIKVDLDGTKDRL